MQIFISYKREDEAFARQLYSQIASWGYSPWLDVMHISADHNWDDAIDVALKASEVVIAVLTPESVASENVKNEWGYAESAQKRLVFVWLRDIPETAIPHRFIRRQRIDFRTDQAVGLSRLKALLESPVKILEEYSAESPAKSLARATDHNRERMLHKVRFFWVESVLEKSLHGAALIELHIEPKPEAVPNPWDTVIQHVEYGDYKLPSRTNVIDVFRRTNHELLILGQPGSGKTTSLLELARDLIDQALADETQPIPVVLNLSSWAVERKPLSSWLVDELYTKYQIPPKIAQRWVQEDALVLLLDGLDEIKTEHRNACVETINTFRHDHRVDMVVCSRTADYEALTKQLHLQSAIVLQPLTPEQIDTYLTNFEGSLNTVRGLLKEDQTLQEMAKSPLMLSILALAYSELPADSVGIINSIEGRRKHLFETYVQRMFARKGTSTLYTSEQTIDWLSWLAQKLIKYRQSVFYIESIQPFWLATRQQVWMYRIVTGLILGLISGLATGIGNGVNFGLAIFAGFSLSFILTRRKGFDFAVGLTIGIAFALPGRTVLLGGPPSIRDFGWLGLPFGLTLGIGLAAISSRTTLLTVDWMRIRPVDTLVWSWSKVLLGLGFGLIFGILGSVVGSLFVGLFLGTLFGITLGITMGFGLMLTLALSSVDVELKTIPNQAIWRSALNGIRVGLLVGAGIGIVMGLVLEKLIGPTGFVYNALAFGLSFTIVGLISSGIAAIQHMIIRLLLYRDRSIPSNYTHFLDFCVDRIFLRKVGGGYIFIHRYLLEYFAEMQPHMNPGSKSTPNITVLE